MQINQNAGRNNSRLRRKKSFQKAVSFLGAFLIILGGIYLVAGLMLNPRFFIADAKEKIGVVKGVMVSVRVVGVPGQPTATATAGCDGLSSKVTLDWEETIDTTSYDIERDGSPLVTGLTETSYEDTVVDAGTNYSYVIISQGPRGTTASNPVAVETLDCTTNVPATCSIVTIGGKNVAGEDGTIAIATLLPTITGTTNIPNAQIRIEISLADPTIINLTANENGYWSWTTPFSLSKERHQLTVTATDPVLNWRVATDTKYFQFAAVSQNEDNNKKENKKTEKTTPFTSVPSVPPEGSAPKESGQPLELSLEVLNPGGAAYVGGDLDLKTSIIPKEIPIPSELTLIYRIYAENGKDILFQQKEDVVLKNSDPQNIFPVLKLPVLLRPGRHIVSVQTTAQESFISAQAFFEVKEMPLFSIGSTNVTWRMIMESVSWAILSLLLIILIFLGLLELEHHRAARALFQITENLLVKRGYFTRRKGVSR